MVKYTATHKSYSKELAVRFANLTDKKTAHNTAKKCKDYIVYKITVVKEKL